MVTEDSHNFSWEGMMSLLIWYSPIPFYFHLFITFLPSLILHHTLCQCDLPHDLCEPSQPPLTIPYTHHISYLTDDLHTVLFPIFSSFQLPNAPCCGLTGHKPSHSTVRALSPVLPHTSLVLALVYHLYLSCLYLPCKQDVFPPEFRLSLFCLIILPCSASYFHLTSYSCTIPHLHFTPSHTPCYHARTLSITPLSHLRISLGSHFNQASWLTLVDPSCAQDISMHTNAWSKTSQTIQKEAMIVSQWPHHKSVKDAKKGNLNNSHSHLQNQGQWDP